jgi:hypothetical protein
MRRYVAIAMLALPLAGCALPAGRTADPIPAPVPAVKPPCAQAVVTIWQDEPTGCDLTPPQRLDVLGLTLAQCDDEGGEYISKLPSIADIEHYVGGVCEGVDY